MPLDPAWLQPRPVGEGFPDKPPTATLFGSKLRALASEWNQVVGSLQNGKLPDGQAITAIQKRKMREEWYDGWEVRLAALVKAGPGGE